MMNARLTTHGRHATVTIADTPTARQFASLLPITVRMRHLFGREKVGALDRAIDDSGRHELRYETGQVAYWPPEHEIAIFYGDEDDRTIPAPGIITLGTIHAGLEGIAAASGDFNMTIEAIR
jgi:hypothetical protein